MILRLMFANILEQRQRRYRTRDGEGRLKTDGSSMNTRIAPPLGEADMRAHLEKILQSPVFERSPRMQRFLRYLCEETFAGRGALLKEYSVALFVFDKPEDFDPGSSATVRVEAGRLRRLLRNYQVDHGHSDTVLLSIPKGGYVPAFEWRSTQPAVSLPDDTAPAKTAEQDLLPGVEVSWLTVLSCSFWSGRASNLTAAFLAEYDRFRTDFSSIMERLGGTIENSAAARLTVYFGWPGALEDAPGRAMTAALEMMAHVRSEHRENCNVRIGIATGKVLSRPCLEQPLILGETPIVASKMLDQTPVNAILISEETRSLARTAFETIPAGAISTDEGQQIPLWRLLAARSTTRFLARHDASPANLIGRGAELELLCSRWHTAAAGEGQSILVEGDAGIGKSRLSEAMIERLRPKGVRIRLQCSAHHSNSALYPLIQFLRRHVVGKHPASAAIGRFLTQFGLNMSDNQILLQTLLAPADLQEDMERSFPSASEKKEKTLQLLIEILSVLCDRRPVILLIEDIHWADPTTLELIGYAASACQDLRLYLVMTGRPGCASRLGPVQGIAVLRLARLARQDCSRMIDSIVGDAALPGPAREAIIDKADGVPLYLEELTKLLLAQDLRDAGPAAVPDSLNDLLASQLDCMGFARRVAQVAAVIGRDFPGEILKVLTGDDRHRLAAAIDQLLAAGILTRSRSNGEGRYSFRHALLRDAAYASMLNTDRKDLHYRTADILVDCFPDIAADHPEIIAGHMREAGRLKEAVPFWLDAGRKAARRYSLVEASRDFRAALDALASVPASIERSERELDTLLELGTTIRDAEGYYAAGLKEIYERARLLAEEVNRPNALAASLHGLWTVAAGRGQWKHADLLAGEFDQFIHRLGKDARLEAEGYRLLGAGAAFRGDFTAAQLHFQCVAAVYDPARHGRSFGYDPGAASIAYLSWVHWHLGNAEEGRREADRALEAAKALGHPATLSLVLVWLLFHAVCERDHERIHSYNDRLQALCSEQICRFWQPFGRACVAWASFHSTRDPSHLDQLLEHTKAFSELYLASCLHLLATDICYELGRFEEGLHHARLAATFMAEHDERIWEAEYWRLLGLLHARRSPDSSEGRHCLEQALATARRQQAVMLERRAQDALEDLPAATDSPGRTDLTRHEKRQAAMPG
ncbi:ATP-binding protein [Sphingobium sp. ZW T5_29]|uniref:ATP-binding protein n=1 Tax=Sphingobium sp. ZW T5_29 TaxID=3378077 RepID=UPI003851C750